MRNSTQKPNSYIYEIHIIPCIEKQVSKGKGFFKIKTYERFHKRNKIIKCSSWGNVEEKGETLIGNSKDSRIEGYFFRHGYINYLKIFSGYGK